MEIIPKEEAQRIVENYSGRGRKSDFIEVCSKLEVGTGFYITRQEWIDRGYLTPFESIAGFIGSAVRQQRVGHRGLTLNMKFVSRRVEKDKYAIVRVK